MEEPIFNGSFKDNSDNENDDKRKKYKLIMNVSGNFKFKKRYKIWCSEVCRQKDI